MYCLKYIKQISSYLKEIMMTRLDLLLRDKLIGDESNASISVLMGEKKIKSGRSSNTHRRINTQTEFANLEFSPRITGI